MNTSPDLSDSTTTDFNSFDSSIVAVVLNRKSTVSSSYEVGMSICIPHKRDGLNDRVRNELQYYSFLDDKRSLSNIDSILGRLVNISVVHVCCTESMSKTPNSSAEQKKAKDLSKLLEKAEDVIESHQSNSVDDSNESNLSNILPALPTQLSSPQLTNEYLENTLPIILEEDSLYQYRNDKSMNDISKRALGLLLDKFPNLAQEPDNTFSFSPGNLSSYLTLDKIAMECINLLPPKKETAKSSTSGAPSSIYEILNKCKTKMGSSLLQNWCRQPLVNMTQINQRLDIVEFLVQDTLTLDALQGALAGVPNLDQLITKISKSASSTSFLDQMYRLYIFVEQNLPFIIQALPEESPLLTQHSENLSDVFSSCGKFCDLVTTVLDLASAPEEFLIKADYAEELKELRQDLDNILNDVKQVHMEMNDAWSSGDVKLEHVKENLELVWRFRLIDSNATKTLESDDSIRVHKILKNGVYFSTPTLRELCAQRRSTLATYHEKQKEIVENVKEVVETYLPIFEKASTIIAQLDVLCSFAHVAAHSPHGYVRPELTNEDGDGAGVVIQEGRHPVVELQELQTAFIPNSFNLQYGSSNFMLITGPNMGGKSTYIRSLAAIVVMAQIGSFVPCASAKINICDSILARVGAGDVQNKGISTFMAEMLEASSILSRATKRSLIIIDELGRGTSTFDGFGLAWAISEYIATRLGCMTVFATHFHELTRLEECVNGVVNYHVTATNSEKKRSLTFLYEVREGPCLESFGIQVAEMANFPTSVIETARLKARELENFQSSDKKRKRKEFLEQFRKLPLDQIAGKDEKLKRVRELTHLIL